MWFSQKRINKSRPPFYNPSTTYVSIIVKFRELKFYDLHLPTKLKIVQAKIVTPKNEDALAMMASTKHYNNCLESSGM
jgi:hypothetical protein